MKLLFLFVTFSLAKSSIQSVDTEFDAHLEAKRCKPVLITIPQCNSMFYNHTGMPNLVGQESLLEAYHQLQTFEPLLTSGCSKRLRFLLCSVYTPMCDPVSRLLVGPCRGLCSHVRGRCEPILAAFSLHWPKDLDCSNFPSQNELDFNMCMEGPQLDEDGRPPSPAEAVLAAAQVAETQTAAEAVKKQHEINHPYVPADAPKNKTTRLAHIINDQHRDFLFHEANTDTNEHNQIRIRQSTGLSITPPCRHLRGVSLTRLTYVNRTGLCGITCPISLNMPEHLKNISERVGLFLTSEIRFAEYLMLVISTIVLAAAFITLATLMLSRKLINRLKQRRGINDSWPRVECQGRGPRTWTSNVHFRFNWDWLDTEIFLRFPRAVEPHQSKVLYLLGWVAFCQLITASVYTARTLMGYVKVACDGAGLVSALLLTDK